MQWLTSALRSPVSFSAPTPPFSLLFLRTNSHTALAALDATAAPVDRGVRGRGVGLVALLRGARGLARVLAHRLVLEALDDLEEGDSEQAAEERADPVDPVAVRGPLVSFSLISRGVEAMGLRGAIGRFICFFLCFWMEEGWRRKEEERRTSREICR